MTMLHRQTSETTTFSPCDLGRDDIATRLAGQNVVYEHVALAPAAFDAEAQPDEVIGSQLEALDQLLASKPCATLGVTSVAPTDPQLAAIERELMIEHAHDGAEAQLLVHGSGVLFLRAGESVLALECEAGDYVCIPAGLGHWFAMDAAQGLCTIQLFENENRPSIAWRGRDMRGRYGLSTGTRGAAAGRGR
jgi:cupin superfamily acireductone dioxygenase involved in methionine salvage